MFEDAELDHRLDPAEWKQQEARLRTALLDAQYDLSQQKRFATLIVIGGVEGAGKGETVNLLHEWMDPRHLLATAFAAPTDEERQRPPMWRFWRALPPRVRRRAAIRARAATARPPVAARPGRLRKVDTAASTPPREARTAPPPG